MSVKNAHFLDFGERKSVKSGAMIFDGVDISKQWFYVEKGMVRVELPSKDGSDQIYYYKDAGHIIDANMVYSVCESHVSLVAVEDCDIYCLSEIEVGKILSAN